MGDTLPLWLLRTECHSVITPLCPGDKEWFWLQRFRLSVYIKPILPESFDVLREIRAEMTDDLGRDGYPFLLKRTEHMGHIHHMVQHHRLGHQGPIRDPLFLLYRIAAAAVG